FLYMINSTFYFTVFQQYTLLHRRRPPFIRQQSAVAGIAVLTTSGLHAGRRMCMPCRSLLRRRTSICH
ncbi:hypothetical protein NCZ44_11820, partial [Bacteroides thetaiotaomicron]|uniref:hypothetical protein n=1 Tax=Bacteroides thetaiotaomicron TaxID=818 RepID=UPI00202FDAA0